MKRGEPDITSHWTTGREVVLTDASIISMDDTIGDVVGDIVIDGDTIRAVGPGAGRQAGDDALLIDASGTVAIPGLIDAHVHAWEGALCGVSPDSDLATYMSLTHQVLGPRMTPEDVALGQRITAARPLDQGVTTIVDNCHNVQSLDHGLAAAQAHLDSGIRAVLAAGVGQGRPAEHVPGVVEELHARYADDSRLSVRLMEVSPTRAGWEFAADHGIGAVAEFGGWVPDLDALLASGLLAPSITLDHCGGLSDDHWRVIADSGAAVALAPRSDPHYGLGASAAVIAANRHGVQEAISSDNEFEYGQDLFTEMQVLLTAQRGQALAATATGGTDVPPVYGVRDVLRAATRGGALAAGLPGRIGVLSPGAKADLALVSLDRLRPIASHLGAVVSYATPADVDTVVVDGVVRKWGGELVGIDRASLVRDAEESRDRLLAEVGVSTEDLRFAGELVVPGE